MQIYKELDFTYPGGQTLTQVLMCVKYPALHEHVFPVLVELAGHDEHWS